MPAPDHPGEGPPGSFWRRSTRTQDGQTHTSSALVESPRTAPGPRQHLVADRGELKHAQQRRWQRTLVRDHRQGASHQLRLGPDDDPVAAPDDPDVARLPGHGRLDQRAALR